MFLKVITTFKVLHIYMTEIIFVDEMPVSWDT